MLVENLNHYVKFLFVLDDSETFVTSDIKELKDFANRTELNIGDSLEIGEVLVKITNIQIKHIDLLVRSNKTGFSKNESPMVGQLKDSLITVVISVEKQHI